MDPSKFKHEFNKKQAKAEKKASSGREWRQQEHTPIERKMRDKQRERTQNGKKAQDGKYTLLDEDLADAVNGLDRCKESSDDRKGKNAQPNDDTTDVKEMLSGMTIQP
ncbi:hypothetical protein AAVH_05196 [Aphelenchoides avenae]|nr:hypothetical protein AAVH_05196 [Aphelenchus avenae]